MDTEISPAMPLATVEFTALMAVKVGTPIMPNHEVKLIALGLVARRQGALALTDRGREVGQ